MELNKIIRNFLFQMLQKPYFINLKIIFLGKNFLALGTISILNNYDSCESQNSKL